MDSDRKDPKMEALKSLSSVILRIKSAVSEGLIRHTPQHISFLCDCGMNYEITGQDLALPRNVTNTSELSTVNNHVFLKSARFFFNPLKSQTVYFIIVRVDVFASL